VWHNPQEDDLDNVRLKQRLLAVQQYYKEQPSRIRLDSKDAAETIIRIIIPRIIHGVVPPLMVDHIIYDLKQDIAEFLRSRNGGSSRRRLHRRRRTQYTKKHKRSSSKTTKRATIKRIKSYRKHTRTIKRRKSRRHQ